MRRAVWLILVGVPVLAGVLFLGACGGDDEDAAIPSATSTGAAAPPRVAIVIRAKLKVAAQDGAEPIATGTILAGSTLGGAPFCAGGKILDSHANLDPEMAAYFIDRKISCADGDLENRPHAGGRR